MILQKSNIKHLMNIKGPFGGVFENLFLKTIFKTKNKKQFLFLFLK